MESFFDQRATFSLASGLITVTSAPASSRLAILRSATAPPPITRQRPPRISRYIGKKLIDTLLARFALPGYFSPTLTRDPLLDKRRFSSNPSVIRTLHYF